MTYPKSTILIGYFVSIIAAGAELAKKSEPCVASTGGCGGVSLSVNICTAGRAASPVAATSVQGSRRARDCAPYLTAEARLGDWMGEQK